MSKTLHLVTALLLLFLTFFDTHVGQIYLREQTKERKNKIAAYVCYIFNYTASSLSVCLYNEQVVSTHFSKGIELLELFFFFFNFNSIVTIGEKDLNSIYFHFKH